MSTMARRAARPSGRRRELPPQKNFSERSLPLFCRVFRMPLAYARSGKVSNFGAHLVRELEAILRRHRAKRQQLSSVRISGGVERPGHEATVRHAKLP
jgi:hypothetical protein